MSDRSYHKMGTQGARHVQYNFVVYPRGVSGPCLGEGDIGAGTVSMSPTGATGGTVLGTQGSWVTVVRGTSGAVGMTGVTGTYVVQTKNPFPGVVGFDVGVCTVGNGNGSSGPANVNSGKEVVNSDGTISIPFTIYVGSTPTDLADDPHNKFYVQLTLRNSMVSLPGKGPA